MTTEHDTPGGTGISEDEWLRKISAILDRADDPANHEGERESSRAMAFRLMSRLGIDEALVRGTKAAPSDPITMMETTLPPPFSDTQALWLGGVAEVLGCKAIISRDYNTRSRKNPRGGRVRYRSSTGPSTLRLFGRQSVLERAMRLVTSLNIQVIYSLAQFQGRPGVNRAFRRAYIVGFAETCRDRLREIHDQELDNTAPADAQKYALVRIDDDKLIADAIRAMFGDDLPPLQHSLSSRAGQYAGHLDGLEADLGHARLGHDRIAIGSVVSAG